MALLLAFLVTQLHPTQSPGLRPAMRSNREERCHPLAADFPCHSRYTEKCWMWLSAVPR